MYCASCGNAVQNDASFCPGCGTRTASAVVSAGGALAATQEWDARSPNRAAAPQSAQAPEPSSLLQAPYASFGARFAALLIDGIAIIIPAIVGAALIGALLAAIVAAGQSAPISLADQQAQSDAIDAAATAGAFAGYIVVFYGYQWIATALGGSLGMRALGLRVVRAEDGEAPGFGKGLARVLVAIVSGLALYLGYLWAAWDDDKQTWHDKAAGTIVVKV